MNNGALGYPSVADVDVGAFAALVSAADQVPYATGPGTWAMTTLTAFARTLLDDVNQAAARTTLALTPGTDVQGYDADLAAIAALTSAADKFAYATGAGTWALADVTSFVRTLLDDADATTALGTLGAQPVDSDLTAIAALTTTSYGRAFLELANAGAARSALLSEQSTITDPTGGGTIDAEARTAINAIIDALQANDIVA